MAQQATQESPRPIRVLSASLDAGLNRSRLLLLQYWGFEATTTESIRMAVELIQKNQFDVLIFGSTLSRDTCWELAAEFRRHNPRGKIIEIIPAAWAAPKNRPDAMVVGSDEPES